LAEVSAVEWALIILCIAAVLGMELMNSAIERAVDKPDTTHWWSAGAAKDMAAGAVLIVALGALCIGCVLLIPRLSVIVDHLRT
ncbi:diacylglycerol kinase, partial [Gemmiger formicilis]